MAFKINEKRMVNDSTFQFEDRLKSPTVRFGDTTPVFTTYYHIDADNTSLDEGFQDIASLLGNQSPLRFNKINDFPLYDVDPIVLSLSDADNGLDSTFESEAKVMPGTIRPFPNDLFMINTLKGSYIFRVTNISYDTLIQNSFYKIEYRLEWIDDERLKWLPKQTVKENVCLLENIGTDIECIIESGTYKKIQELESNYVEIRDLFKTLYYNQRHNVMTIEVDPYTEIYDPFMCDFINKHNLLNDKRDLYTILLTDQYRDGKRKIKYSKSVYEFIEKRDIRLARTFNYQLRPGIAIPESSFATWYDKKIKVVDILPYKAHVGSVFTPEFVSAIQTNNLGVSECGDLIIKYIRDDDLNLNSITDDLITEILYMDNTIEQYFMIPIILYIIRYLIKKETEK